MGSDNKSGLIPYKKAYLRVRNKSVSEISEEQFLSGMMCDSDMSGFEIGQHLDEHRRGN